MLNSKYVILGLLICLSYPLFALDERERKVFVRKCYAQLTSREIPPDSVYLQQAALGVNPVELCMQILDRASFNNKGRIDVAEEKNTGQYILSNMHRLHSSFFQNRSFQIQAPQTTRTTNNYFDTSQPALYITKALFSDWTYDKAITTQSSLQAIREHENPDLLIWHATSMSACTQSDLSNGCGRRLPKVYNPNSPILQHSASASCKNNPNQNACKEYKMMKANIPMASRGKIFGVESHKGVNLPYGAIQYQGGEKVVPEAKNLAKNLGAGIIGDVVFIISNISTSAGYKSNGAMNVPRSWSKAVYEDVLCRRLPALRSSDVGFLISDKEGTPSFRTGTSCLRCHSSMDQTAGNLRNLQFLFSGSIRGGPEVIGSVRNKPWSIASEKTWTEVNDTSFHNTSPKGRLFYRDYKGDLVHKTTNNLAELGEAISKTDDYYMCAAKNYYKHFMNVELQLLDPGASEYVADDELHKKELIEIGLRFKEHKQLKLLIKDIFSSSLYLTGGR